MRFNEIINLFLWKQLPYDIKCLLYFAVAGYHKRRMTTGYCDVIKTIKNINNTGNNVDNCNNSLNLLKIFFSVCKSKIFNKILTSIMIIYS